MLFDNFPRIKLMDCETPLQRLYNYGSFTGLDTLYIKRDDFMELGMGGNKIRSLEFWLGEAKKEGCDVVLVAGLPPSNLCRLTAAACARLSLECHIIHNASPDLHSSVKTGNPLLNSLLGAKIIYCGDVDEYKRHDFTVDYKKELEKEGKKPYIVGDPVLGAMGYVCAAHELVSQCEREHIDLKHIFLSASAGPTETGFLFGLCMAAQNIKLHLVSVEYDRVFFLSIMEDIFTKLSQSLNVLPSLKPSDVIVFHDEYLGEGYGKPTSQSIQSVKNLAMNEGIFIETTYNAKVFAALEDLAFKGDIGKDEAVCIYHTGGTAALFGQGEYFKQQ